jgi:hypothetical protein
VKWKRQAHKRAKFLGNYHVAHVQRSASGQIIAESNHINDVILWECIGLYTSQIEGMQVNFF